MSINDAASTSGAQDRPVWWRRRAFRVIIGLLFSLGGLYLAFEDVVFGDVVDHLERVDLLILSLCLACQAMAFLIWASRSRVLFAPMGMKTPLLLKSVLLAFAGNVVLPLRLGEVLRVAYLSKKSGVATSSVLATVAIERIFDLFGLSLLALMCLPVAAESLSTPVVIGAVTFLAAGLGGAIYAAKRPDRVVGWMQTIARPLGAKAEGLVQTQGSGFLRGLAGLEKASAVIAVVSMSVVYMASSAVFQACAMWAFGMDLPWYAPFVLAVLATFGTALPSSPGFVGTYHYFTVVGLGLFGVPASEAASFALVTHALSTLPATLLAMLVLGPDFVWNKSYHQVGGDEDVEQA